MLRLRLYVLSERVWGSTVKSVEFLDLCYNTLNNEMPLCEILKLITNKLKDEAREIRCLHVL